ncbi:TPA: O27 family O-antigen polymerase, partial [Escherichia coli]
LIVFSAMTALSITIFNRYFIGLISPLVFIGGVSCLSRLSFKPLFQMIIIITLLFNILVINIFLERRQIIMAKMWRGLYLPPAFSLLYSMRDFDNYLKEIDNDGNWVKNRLAE